MSGGAPPTIRPTPSSRSKRRCTARSEERMHIEMGKHGGKDEGDSHQPGRPIPPPEKDEKGKGGKDK
ncbi:hypothetical protein GCM10022254_28020 [Actinomadura meridiana]|uniref:Uncharacterized protein n=1 Tax=Actinomadura meridiana TaxID=559626 RepID=A0ABP8BZY2_9ACTN